MSAMLLVLLAFDEVLKRKIIEVCRSALTESFFFPRSTWKSEASVSRRGKPCTSARCTEDVLLALVKVEPCEETLRVSVWLVQWVIGVLDFRSQKYDGPRDTVFTLLRTRWSCGGTRTCAAGQGSDNTCTFHHPATVRLNASSATIAKNTSIETLIFVRSSLVHPLFLGIN